MDRGELPLAANKLEEGFPETSRSAALFWSAPAERSGDGALNFLRTAMEPSS
jgi:hypothetical protein